MSSSITRYFPVILDQRRQASQERENTAEHLPPTELEQISESASQPATLAKNLLESDPDERLIDGLCSGDTEALTILFRRYARLVRSVAYKILRDRSEADDLLQEVFLLIHKKAASFDGSKASARVWILQIAYHRALSRRRYLTRRHFYTQVDFEDVAPQLPDCRSELDRVERLLDSSLKNAALQELMAGLSDNQQKTLRLYFFGGYTLEEIASELGQTKDNVRHYYFRGLEKLRKQIFSNIKEEKLRKQIFSNRKEEKPRKQIFHDRNGR